MSDLEVAPVGKIWSDQADAWVDDSECCDVDYTCTFPPCVAAQVADMQKYAIMFGQSSNSPRDAHSTAQRVIDEYDLDDPKHPDYLENLLDRLERINP